MGQKERELIGHPDPSLAVAISCAGPFKRFGLEFFFFFVPSQFYYVRPSSSLSLLLNSRNSDQPLSHTASLFSSPLSTMVGALQFYRENSPALSSRVDWRRICAWYVVEIKLSKHALDFCMRVPQPGT